MIQPQTTGPAPAPVPPSTLVSLAPPRRIGDEISISLFAIVHRLISGRWLIAACALLGLVIGLVLAFTTPPYFVAQAVFLPPVPTEPTLSPTALFFPREDPTDMYLSLLASRSVQDDVIGHLGLMSRFKTTSPTDARGTLQSMSRFAVSRNQLITVAVVSRDPSLAAEISNAYLDALYRLNGSMVSSASSHREHFFDQQLREQKEALAQAETGLRETEEKTGVLLPQGEAEAGISATAQLQSQINSAETRLSGLLTGATEQNPEVVQARRELASLRAQLASQQASTHPHRSAGGLASTAELPSLTLEYSRRARDLKQRETVYDTLVQQYERARLASIDPGPQLQIVDRAIRPERKAGPRKRNFCIAGIALGLAVACAWLLLAAPVRKLYRDYKSHTLSAS